MKSRTIITFSLSYTNRERTHKYTHDLYIDDDLEDPSEYLESEASTLLNEFVRDLNKETGIYQCEFSLDTDIYRQTLSY